MRPMRVVGPVAVIRQCVVLVALCIVAAGCSSPARGNQKPNASFVLEWHVLANAATSGCVDAQVTLAIDGDGNATLTGAPQVVAGSDMTAISPTNCTAYVAADDAGPAVQRVGVNCGTGLYTSDPHLNVNLLLDANGVVIPEIGTDGGASLMFETNSYAIATYGADDAGQSLPVCYWQLSGKAAS